MSFEKDGFQVIKNFITTEQVSKFRQDLDEYLANTDKYHGTGETKILPGFAGNITELNELNHLHQDPKLLSILDQIVFKGKEFVFVNHSDLHQNKTTGWHRDTKDYERGQGNVEDTWDSEYLIIKACVLLQDHIDNNYGLWFESGTHKKGVRGKAVHAYTNSTDLIIFDQRIRHKGQTKKPTYKSLFNQNRYLITYGYGLNNRHSVIHERGATSRQRKQLPELSEQPRVLLEKEKAKR